MHPCQQLSMHTSQPANHGTHPTTRVVPQCNTLMQPYSICPSDASHTKAIFNNRANTTHIHGW